MHIEAISNGLGGASTMLLILMAEGLPLDAQFMERYNTKSMYKINIQEMPSKLSSGFEIVDGIIKLRARLSITGDMGKSERDRLWNSGRRSSSGEYFAEIIQPYAARHGLNTVLTRALDENGDPLPNLEDVIQDSATLIPTFGSRGGQNKRQCTEKYKIRAVRQELRRCGATSASVALSLTWEELHRMKPASVQWATNWYPLVELRMSRREVQIELERRSFPYLMSTECDYCPFQDWSRWNRLSPKRLTEIIQLEAKWGGEQFLTDTRKPLSAALEDMKSKANQPQLFCDTGGYCGDNMEVLS